MFPGQRRDALAATIRLPDDSGLSLLVPQAFRKANLRAAQIPTQLTGRFWTNHARQLLVERLPIVNFIHGNTPIAN